MMIRRFLAPSIKEKKENVLSSELENKREFNENKVAYDLCAIITGFNSKLFLVVKSERGMCFVCSRLDGTKLNACN